MKDIIIKLWTKFRRFITYGFVGCINTLIDFLTFTLAGELLGLSAGLSQAVGYSCGVICSFTLNRRLTFRDGTSPLWQQTLLFILVNVISLVLSSLFIQFMHNAGLNRYIAKIIDVGVFTVFNFLAYKLVVFRVKN